MTVELKSRRYSIIPEPTSARVKKPYPYLPRVGKVGLAKTLITELFHLNFKLLNPDYRAVLLSRPCIYGVFDGPFGGFSPIVERCTGCLRCVQEFPDFCTVDRNPEFNQMMDSYWAAKDPMRASTHPYHIVCNEVEDGKVPVRGMGYKGSFSDTGFDAIWFDMSEIVRPTRDGIYGREYISTAVDLGRRQVSIFEEESSRRVTLPLPIIIDHIPCIQSESVDRSIMLACERTGTRSIGQHNNHIQIGDSTDAIDSDIIELEYNETLDMKIKNIRENFNGVIIVRIRLDDETISRIDDVIPLDIDGFHLEADYHANTYHKHPKHLTDGIRLVHRHLVILGLRDRITLIASGGIILAEHVAKTILCGADLVAIDTAVLVALQLKFKGECRDPLQSRFYDTEFDSTWGSKRIINLLSTWHNQLLEVLSAMGIRDVRRLRGETGRAIFKDEVEREAFGQIKGYDNE